MVVNGKESDYGRGMLARIVFVIKHSRLCVCFLRFTQALICARVFTEFGPRIGESKDELVKLAATLSLEYQRGAQILIEAEGILALLTGGTCIDGQNRHFGCHKRHSRSCS